MNSKLAAGFVYRMQVHEAGNLVAVRHARNLFPIQGRNYLLNAGIGGAQQVTQWYIGLFGGNYTPNDNDTAASFPAAAQEVVSYVSTQRGLLVTNPPVAGEIDSSGNEVVLTLSANAIIYGAFITSSPTKGSAGGILLSAARFENPQQGYAGQTVTIGAVCSLINL